MSKVSALSTSRFSTQELTRVGPSGAGERRLGINDAPQLPTTSNPILSKLATQEVDLRSLQL